MNTKKWFDFGKLSGELEASKYVYSDGEYLYRFDGYVVKSIYYPRRRGWYADDNKIEPKDKWPSITEALQRIQESEMVELGEFKISSTTDISVMLYKIFKNSEVDMAIDYSKLDKLFKHFNGTVRAVYYKPRAFKFIFDGGFMVIAGIRITK